MTKLKDIAMQAGVSVPTVSRILNPFNKIRSASDQTESVVRRIASELNYSPNASARALSTRRTHNIGIMWDKRMDSREESVFWSPVLRGLMAGGRAAGYECMVSVEDYYNGNDFELPRGFRELYVDGLIITYPLGDAQKRIQKKLIDSGIPFVVIWSAISDNQVWTVDLDPNPGFRQAILHLYERGHRNIGYCVYPHWQVGEYHASAELEAQVRAEFGIELAPLEVDLTRYSHLEEGQRLANSVISGQLDVSAVIMGDAICIHLIRCLADAGVAVPGDFSVVAMANTYLCDCSSPRLTTIDSPLVQLGEKAATLLSDCIRAKVAGVNLKPQHVMLPQGFVVRESTGSVSRRKRMCRK